MSDFKTELWNFLQKDSVSFVELSRQFPDQFHGNQCLEIEGHNIVMWANLTEEAATIISELRDSDHIEYVPCGMLPYVIDGGGLDLPLAKQARRYKKEHWLPVVIKLKAPAKYSRICGNTRVETA